MCSTDAAPRELINSGNGISMLTESSFSAIMDQMAEQYVGQDPYILIDSESNIVIAVKLLSTLAYHTEIFPSSANYFPLKEIICS